MKLEEVKEDLGKSVSLDMVLIRAGKFIMGLACHQKSPQYVKVVSGRKRVKHTRG